MISNLSKELTSFAKEIYVLLDEIDIKPIIYGSLAYSYHTKDKTLPIRDIDLLVPESYFTSIIKILDTKKNIIYQITSHHSIEVFKDNLKIDIDSIEYYLDPRSREYSKTTINNTEYNFLNITSLIDIYKRALSDMPLEPKLDKKRKEYQKKLKNMKII